jgi:tetratricopeptide (TPR) repeat protein
MDDNILKPIDVMEINELIAVLTIRKDEFNEDYREKVLVELNNRGVKLKDVLKVAEFKMNFDEFEKIDVSAAHEKLSLIKDPLDVLYFRNYMAEILFIQKNSSNFVVHHYNEKAGFSTFFLENETLLKKSLDEFLSFGNWLPEETEIVEDWDTFTESNSSAYIIRLTNLLDQLEIEYCLNSNRLARFNSVNSSYSIILAAEDVEEAEEVFEVIDKLQNKLHDELEIAESNKDAEKQLEILIELESLTPEDSALYYNKAQLLDAKGEYQEASDALIESFNLDIANGEVEDIEETENYLKEMLGRVKNKINILHCLATIAAFKNEIDDAIIYYNQLIEIDENDPIAHLNLGHHYYSHTEDDDKVKLHFNKFLELEPESDERETIEVIINNLA